MKIRFFAAFALAFAMALLAGCAGTGTLHQPSTAGNTGTAALVAYAVGGFGAGRYLALDACAKPPVYPCKTQALNDKVVLVDTAAYNAAVAADKAGNDPAALKKAAEARAALEKLNASPEVKDQVDMAAAKKAATGATP